MLYAAHSVDWTLVANEVEALQLEYTWIKEFDPRFNVRFRDDKSYPWLAITINEDIPRVMVVRGARKKGVKYFGPYSQAWAIRDTVDQLLRVFPMRSCSPAVFRRAELSSRPCLLGDIGKCAAPCVGRVSASEHRQIVDDFMAFLSGRSKDYLKRLTLQMHEASESQDYERAARLRDGIEALNRALERNTIVLSEDTDADIIALAEDPLEVAVQIFHVRAGRVRGQRGWIADKVDEADTATIVERAIIKLYDNESDIPKEVLVPAQPANQAAVTALLTVQRGGPIQIRTPQRGDRKRLMETVAMNAQDSLVRHKIKRAGDLTTRSLALEEIREALNLEEAPLRIECFDISNLQDTNAVASMVVFEDGLPAKKYYRKFAITQENQNDTAAIAEVISRRFAHLNQSKESLEDSHSVITEETPRAREPRRFAYRPQLIIVDGGLPQVNAAKAALEEIGITDIALVGLAKRLEEIWLPHQADPIILPRSSEGLYLMQRVRDEAHRFAISFHRAKRSKSMTQSVLDDIPGLGPIRRKALMKHFGSMKKLKTASVEEIASVTGISSQLARDIVSVVSEKSQVINTATGEVIEE